LHVFALCTQRKYKKFKHPRKTTTTTSTTESEALLLDEDDEDDSKEQDLSKPMAGKVLTRSINAYICSLIFVLN
jgi:hypothetical protein